MHTRSKRLMGLVAVTAAAVLGVAACGSGGGTDDKPDQSSPGFAKCDQQPDTCNSGEVKKGGELTFVVEQEWTGWNENTDDGNMYALSQTLQGITVDTGYFAPSGEWKWNLNLLTEPAKITTQDPQTWVYKIRPEAKWDDGTDITAKDIDLLWRANAGKEELCTKCPAPASTSGFELIKSVVGSDGGKTVTVTLEAGKKYPEWFALFGGLYPAHLAEKQGFKLDTGEGVAKATEWFHTEVPKFTGGPYKIESYTKGVSVVQVPNPNYYGPKANLDKLIFRWITQQDQIIPALRNNEVQATQAQPNGDLVTQAGQIPGVHYRIGHGYQWEHYDLNLKNKWLADKALRQAIFTAINVQNLINKTYGTFDKQAKPLGSHSFFPSDKKYKDVIKDTGQGTGDVEKAKKILTDAGYKLEGGVLKDKTGAIVGPLRLRHTKGNALRATSMELLQSELKSIGIDSKIEVTETLGRTLSTADFDIIIFAWVGSPLFQGAAEQNWVTNGGGNYGKYSNPEVDRLVKEAAQELDQDKAAKLLNDALTIMAQDAYVLPLIQKPTFLAVYDKYLNIRDNPTNSGPHYNNGEWGLKAA